MSKAIFMVGNTPVDALTSTSTNDAIQKAVKIANILDKEDRESKKEFTEPNEVFIYKAVLSLKIVNGEEQYKFYAEHN